MHLVSTACQSCIQLHLLLCEHSSDLGVEVELRLSDLPGFADLLICEVALDQRLVLGFYCY
ncbi:hypothetical protein CFBP2118_02415 [Pseudomonas syringae pv. syringae]|nr:hypothetical protein CFBP2118_02415 [Pseudomonas syringae pv. syringae]